MNLAAFLLTVTLLAALHRLGRLRELHHGYYGLALYVVPWFPVRVIGLIILLDDAIQHTVQCWYPTFNSGLHQLYGVVYARVAWVRRLNVWLDRVLG